MKNKLLWFLIITGAMFRLFIIFDQKQLIKLPDSELYLSLAKDYFKGNFHPDFVRMPGYSFLIYLVFLIFGWGKLKIIFLLQHSLTLLSCVFIYKIIEKKIKNKKILFTLGMFIFANYSTIQWGQILMPEALLIFFTSLFAFLALYLKSAHRFLISLLLPITLIILGLIKPLYLSYSFIYLAYIFLSRKKYRLIVIFQTISLSTIILLYMLWNKNTNGYFGISTSDSTTVFGKIVNFKIENCSTSENDSVFHKRLQKYLLNSGKRDWYQFVYSYKKEGGGENLNTFQDTYKFNSGVIINCPVRYITKSSTSLFQTFFTYKNYLDLKNSFLKKFAGLSVTDYFWGFIFIITIPFVFKKKKLVIITIFVLYNLFSIFLFAADSFYRLRVPFQLLFFLYLILFFEEKEDKTEEKIAKS